jgi:hypothetical protein
VSGQTSPVIFLSSLGHSGSTVLERALSTHPRIVGLGEVHQLLTTLEARDDVPTHPCGCGQPAQTCALWGPVLARLRGTPLDAVERYRTVLATFADVLGADAVVVDSSKSGRALRDLRQATDQVAAVDLTRDVRSWTVAMLDRAARRPAGAAAARGMRGQLADTAFGLFRTWHRMNRSRKADLHATVASVAVVGLEPIAADPDRELARLLTALDAAFDRDLGLGEDLSARTGDLATASVHTIFGNNMKLSAERRARLVGDLRWQQRTEWQIPALLLRSTMRQNRAWVYADADARAFTG